SRRSPMSVSSACPTSSRKETRFASRYSKSIARVASACRCATSTPPKGASGANRRPAGTRAALGGGRVGGLHQRAKNLFLGAVPALIVLRRQVAGGSLRVAGRRRLAQEQPQDLLQIARQHSLDADIVTAD